MKYYERMFDDLLDEYLEMVSAILIMGPKWCGKTTTAERHAKSVIKLQDPKNLESYKQLAQIEPFEILNGEKPRLIDEWQIEPRIWDAVRVSVDNINKEGLYILTGSTTVDESKIMHSGTGRITRLIMRPMSLYESNESNGKIRIIDLFNNPDLDINGIKSDLTIKELRLSACRGGWPSTLNRKNRKAQLFEAYNYIESICRSDMTSIDGVKRDPNRVKAILRSYARNISTIVNNRTILKDIKDNYVDMSAPTLHSYVTALEKLFVIFNINAWNPNIRSKTSIKSTTKKEFIDPSIAVAALGLEPEALLYDLKTFGFIFENLCIRDLSVYITPFGGEISYYRDRHGLEADCVIHLKDGRYGLIEFKLGGDEIDKGAENLLSLKKLIKKSIKEKKLSLREPSFLAVITGGELAYTREDGVKVIPIGVLK